MVRHAPSEETRMASFIFALAAVVVLYAGFIIDGHDEFERSGISLVQIQKGGYSAEKLVKISGGDSCPLQAVDTSEGCPVYGAFPAECGCLSENTTTGSAVGLTAKESICGCVESEDDLDADFKGKIDGRFGCKAGPNPVSPLFDHAPWCYMKNDIACPAAFASTIKGQPAMRICGKFGFADAECSGENCDAPFTFEKFLEHVKDDVHTAFHTPQAKLEGKSVYDHMMDANKAGQGDITKVKGHHQGCEK